jgi:hypothetical protein
MIKFDIIRGKKTIFRVLKSWMLFLVSESLSWSPKVLHGGLDAFLEQTNLKFESFVTNVGPKKGLKPNQHSIKSLNQDLNPH